MGECVRACVWEGGGLLDLTRANALSLFRFQRKKMSARLLEHDRGTTSEAKHVDRKIARVLKHPGYSDVTFNNDIALLRLDKEVAFDDTVRPACLPPAGKSFSGKDGIVTGWGVSTPGGSTNQVLHEVSVPIMSNKDCRKSNYGAKRITDNMMCAGYPEGKKDSCQVTLRPHLAAPATLATSPLRSLSLSLGRQRRPAPRHQRHLPPRRR